MNIKDKVIMERNQMQPHHAEGHICIDLTDPSTGKVKERIQGKNMTFPVNVYKGTNWADYLNSITLALTDNVNAIDSSLPFVPGQVVGYGLPSSGSLGTYRGAYNAANQVLSRSSLSSKYYKYQYDFTTAQANGTIGTIGLSRQYYSSGVTTDNRCFTIANSTEATVSYTHDGRYGYVCSSSGIISKYDFLLGTTVTIDVSAVVGSTTANPKGMVYFPSTGKYGVYVYSTTAANIRLYIFTSNTFASLESTCSPSNVKYSEVPNVPLYGYGDYLFCVSGSSILCANYVTNSAFTTIPIAPSNYAKNENLTNYTITVPYKGTLAMGRYIFFGISYYSSYYYGFGGIIDMSTMTQIGYLCGMGPNSYPLCRSPIEPSLYLPAIRYTTGGNLQNGGAAAVKKLDTPVVKTSANGMTVTYELEVFWQ